MNAPSTTGEQARLQALLRYRILDTASEESLDGLTSLAANICGTPIALISLVDEHRQWFKSRIGIDAQETERSIAFCSHAIEEESGILVVPDATVDSRFSSNPLVTGAPDIRFYAGASLEVVDGHRLGTLCVIGQEPQELRPDQLEALRILRDAVVTQLELRRLLLHVSYAAKQLSMCAWCRSVETPDGSWAPVHEYLAKVAHVSHGMCPECEQSFPE